VLTGRAWFDEHAVNFGRHYTGSLACVPSRPTIFTGQYPDVHGVTQTDGLGKMADDSRMRWLPPGEVPTLGHWFRAAGYDTHYDGKWHVSHADLTGRPARPLATNDDDGNVDQAAARPTSPPTRSTVRLLGLGRPRTARRAARQQRPPCATR
jgi:arylsulfatase A-like enzyme